METAKNTSRLFHACQVLFGPDIDVSSDFLRYLQMTGLKAVYRKKALDTHPDRALTLATEPLVLAERFREVHAAYRELYDYLASPSPLKFGLGGPLRKPAQDPSPQARSWKRDRTRGTDAFREGDRRFSRATLPQRSLLFGQYIYYSGLISYRELIDALVWQKVQRPLLGRIGIRWKWLQEEDVRAILHRRRGGERFGEAALRGGYLTPERLKTMLGWQGLLQPRIGRFFVEKGILEKALVEELAEKSRLHNRPFRHRSP
jgi:hypothetical protein